MLGRVFGRHASSVKTVAAFGCSGFELASARDLGGFDLGVIVDKQREQVTIGLSATKDTEPDFATVDAWVEAVVTVSDVVAVSVVQRFGTDEPTRAFVTMRTTTSVAKDRARALNELEVMAPDIYAPDGVAIDWWPLSAADVIETAQKVWGPDTSVSGDSAFPPRAEVVQESERAIVNDSVFSSVFELDCNDAVGREALDELGELLVAYESQVPGCVCVVRTLRPTDATYMQLHPDTEVGRCAALVVVSGDSRDVVGQMSSSLLAALSVRCRLRWHRLFGRQHLGVLAAAGLPVYGWQQHVALVRT